MEKKTERDRSYKKGKEAYETQDYEEAIAYLEEAIRISPDKLACFYFAESLGKLNRPEEAIKWLEKTYEILGSDKETKEHIIVLQSLLTQYKNMGRFDKARECIDRILAMATRMQSILKKNDLDDLKKEIKQEEKDIECRTNFARARHPVDMSKQAEELEKRRSYKEALELYTKCLEEKESPELLFKRARCNYMAQDYANALKDFDLFLKLPKSLSIREENLINESYYYQGLCHLETGALKEALILLRRACEKFKDVRTNKEMFKEVEIQYFMAQERQNVKV